MRSIKAVPAALAAAAAFAAASVPIYAQGANVRSGIYVSDAQASAGDTVTVTVMVPAAENADTVSIRAGFNADVFEVVSWAPVVSGGVAGNGEGFFALAAANAERRIDLSEGLSLTAQLKVKDDAPSGNYSISLLQNSISYVADNGYDFIELWEPVQKAVSVSVNSIGGANDDTGESDTFSPASQAAEYYSAPSEEGAALPDVPESSQAAETSASVGTEAPSSDDGYSAPSETAPQIPISAPAAAPAVTTGQMSPESGSYVPAPSKTVSVRVSHPDTGVGAAVAIPIAAAGCVLLGRKIKAKRIRTKKHI